MKNKPLVSIVTPVYNAERYISQCIESVKKQSYKNFEMILVDDCSSDKSVNIINSLIKNDSRFILLKKSENSGAAKTRNLGIEKAKGKYIAFLDSDDLWLENKLKIQIDFMESNQVDFSFSSYNLINEEGNKTSSFIIPKTIVTYKDLLKTCSIGCLTAIYNQESLGKHYMKLIKKRQDYTLWLTLLKQTNAYGLKEVLAEYRITKNSLSSNKFSATKFQWFVYREIEKLPLYLAVYYFINYAFHGVFKYR